MKRYVEVRELGAGIFGSTTVVQDTKAKGHALLRTRKATNIGTLSKQDLEETLKEIRYFARLRHPAITRLFDLAIEAKHMNVIREYCETSLDAIIHQTKRDGRSLNETQILNWFVQTLFGLYYLHDKKVLHKNLKPSNILIQNNTAKLTDIGLSRIIMHDTDCNALFPFTPHYLAPEVITYSGYEQASDVWSVGCILYEMCALSHAFDFVAGTTTTKMLFRIANTGVSLEAPKIPSTFSPHIQRILDLVLVRDAKSRPTCADILRSPFIAKHILQLLRIQPAKATAQESDENVAEIIANISINPRKRDGTFATLREYIKQSGAEIARDFLPKKAKDQNDDPQEAEEQQAEEESEEMDQFPDEMVAPESHSYLRNHKHSVLNSNYKVPIGDETKVPRIRESALNGDDWNFNESFSPCQILDEEPGSLMKLLPIQNEREQTGKSEEADTSASPGKSPDENDSDDEQVGATLARTPSAKRDLIMFDPAAVADPFHIQVGRAKYASLVAKAQKAFGSRYEEVHSAVTKALKSDGWTKDKTLPPKSFTNNGSTSDMLIMEQIVFLELNC